MAFRYTCDQLLNLRESPLVAKPTSLPPIEEWMGPPVESTQKRPTSGNVRTESQSKPYPKAPNGGILLGPSKASFPSSSISKTSGSPFDSPSRSAFGNFAASTPREDYFAKARQPTRTSDEVPEDRTSTQRIRPQRGEPSNWSTSWDENDKSGRRTVREADGDPQGRDTRGQRSYDGQRKEGEDQRRNGAGRAGRPSWLREDEPTEQRSREGLRTANWRDGDRSARRPPEREWNSSSRDPEPEWMGSDDRDDNKGRSIQDIENWKASMRAKEKSATPAESSGNSNPHSRTASHTLTKVKSETPLMLDPSMEDKFFGLMGQSKERPSGPKTEGTTATAKAPKASKFSGFFGPQTPASVAEAVAPPPPPPPGPQAQPQTAPTVDLGNDDKAGFQRILAMLAAPQGQVPGALVQPPQSAPPRRGTPPGENAALHTAHSPPPIISPRSRRPGALENLLSMQSPREGSAQPQMQPSSNNNNHSNKDASFLLNLLRSRNGEGASLSNMGESYGPPPYHGGPPPGFENEQRPGSGGGGERQHDRGGGGGMFDDFGSQRPGPGDGPPPNHSHQRQPHTFDDSDDRPPLERMSSGGPSSGAGGPGGYPPPFPPMGGPPPPGLQRPPGFEHMPPPPPGFGQFMASQGGPLRPLGGGGMPALGPPPGFGRPPPGHAGLFPPGLVPGMGNLNLGDRPGSRDGPDSMHTSGPPPGFGPGPSSMRGPPPGFLPNGFPAGPGHGPRFGPPPGMPEGFPGGPPPPGHGGPPPPPQRMIEMFAEGGYGARGGPPPGPPPGFRRE